MRISKSKIALAYDSILFILRKGACPTVKTSGLRRGSSKTEVHSAFLNYLRRCVKYCLHHMVS